MNNLTVRIWFTKAFKVFLVVAFFSLVLGLFSTEIKDPDFWWHLKTGEYIYQHGALPETDPFAYTSLSKDPVHPESKRIEFILTQYWLVQVLFSWIYGFSGFQGIIFLRASVLTLLVFLVYRALRKEGTGLSLSLILIAPVILMLHNFTGERPQLFSFFFSFFVIFLIERFIKAADSETLKESPSGLQNQSSRVSGFALHIPDLWYLFPLPFILFLWANFHGGFILGIAIILSYVTAESIKYFAGWGGNALSRGKFRFLLSVAIISCIVSMANPNGFNVLFVLIEYEAGTYKQMIVESMSPLFLLRSGFRDAYLILYFPLLIFSTMLLFLNLKKIDLKDVFLTTGLTIMSLSSARYIPFYLPVSVLMIARYGLPLITRITPRESLIKIWAKSRAPLSAILLIAIIMVINNANLFREGVRANRYPEGAAKFLKINHIAGNMFNPYIWGGYLMWELYPKYKVFIDGRGLIGEVFFQEVKVMEASPKRLSGIPEWKAILTAYKVNFIITYSVGNFTGWLIPLIPAILNDSDWHLIYMDNISLIFVRDTPQNEEIIKQFSIPKEWLWNEVAVEAALKAKDYPANMNYSVTMGNALLSARKYVQAKNVFLQILNNDPQNKIAKKRLDLLRSFGY
ncbi:MAG: hypothetical protein L6290_05185 [Thermodesulfovibrionales bacterium]|nr:hypothetical protein [Thermodesulfovibrionales bacterium]